MPLDQRQECGRLRKGSNGSIGKRIAVSVMAIGDSLDRVAEYLDRRFRNMQIVVGCTRLAKILQKPSLLLSSFDIAFR